MEMLVQVTFKLDDVNSAASVGELKAKLKAWFELETKDTANHYSDDNPGTARLINVTVSQLAVQ